MHPDTKAGKTDTLSLRIMNIEFTYLLIRSYNRFAVLTCLRSVIECVYFTFYTY